MSTTYAILISLVICIASAILEGIGAGKDVKGFFARLHSPRFSPPLWVWYIIGVVYYAMCFFLAYRILRHANDAIKYAALILLLVYMSINAIWNFIFFRARNMFYAFLIGLPYIPIAIGLFFSLLQFDLTAAYVFLPYLFYLIYATWLGYQNWQLNKDNDIKHSGKIN